MPKLSQLSPEFMQNLQRLSVEERDSLLQKYGIEDDSRSVGDLIQERPSEGSSIVDMLKGAARSLPGVQEQNKAQDVWNRGSAAAMAPLIGGASVPAIGINAAIGAKYGPDPTSGQGMGATAVNMLAGKFMPLLPGRGMNNLKNVAIGAGQGAASYVAGSLAEKALGEKPTEMSPAEILMQGAVAGAGPAIINRLGNALPAALEKAPPAVRERLLKLLQPMMSQPSEAGVQIQQQEAVPNVANAGKTIKVDTNGVPLDMNNRLEGMIRTLGGEPYKPPQVGGPDNTAALMAESIRRAKAGQNGLQMAAEAQVPKPVAAFPFEKAPTSVRGAEVTATETPTLNSIFKQAGAPSPFTRTAKIKGEDLRVASDLMGGKPPTEFISEVLDSPDTKSWAKLPQVIEKVDGLYKNNEFRKEVQTQIVSRLGTGIGAEGEPFGDLSLLQRLKAFHNADLGGTKGRDVLKNIFDGSTEAASNLETMGDILDQSKQNVAGGIHDRLQVLKKLADPKEALGALGAGTAFSFIFPMHSMLEQAAPAAAGAATYRMITLGADAMAEYMAKNHTKFANVLYDLTRGSAKHSAGTVNNIISGLRRKAIDEKNLTEEERDEYMRQQEGK